MSKRQFIFLLIVLLMLAIIPVIVTVPVQAQNLGTNWQGEFFNNTNLSGSPAATAFYPNGIQQNWGSGPPRDGNGQVVPGIGADNFSARFTSTQNFAQAGTWEFNIFVNDGVRVYINNALVLDQFAQFNDPSPNAFQTFTFTQQLSGSVGIRVEMVEFSDDANLVFQWRFLGQGGGGIATSTPQPAATASVVRVRGLAVRTGPFLGASLITVARPDTAYPILAQNNNEGLFMWYKLQVGDSVGWSSGRYLEVTGDLNVIPFEDTIFTNGNNTNDLPPRLDVVGVPRAIMNFRQWPSERTQIIGKIPWGGEVRVLRRTLQGGKSHWLQVQYEGQIGWIYAPFVGMRGTVDALPIW